MQYLLMIYGNEASGKAATPTDMQQVIAAYGAYSQALVAAGVMVSGQRLQPSSAATTVRITNGKTAVLNGPYADTREQLGGYYLIEAADLDAAISWAARCPGAAHGTMEVRPVWAM